MRFVVLSGLVLSLFVSACKAPPLPVTTVPETDLTIGMDPAVLRLGANDRVRVDVYGHPELSTPETGALVDVEGNLNLPLIGTVPIDGLAPSAVTDELQARYARYLKEPQVSFLVLEYGARRFYVFGEVQAPGAYVLDRPLSALQGLSLAGGYIPGADRESICLLRSTGDFLEVHVFNGATPDGRGLVAIHPDDFLYVRQTGGGSFREQTLPILQGLLPAVSSLINLGLVADAIND